MSLRARLLLGIAAANLAAFAALTAVVLRQVELRDAQYQQVVRQREELVKSLGDLFGAALSDIDFSAQGFAQRARKVLNREFWNSARDAYIVDLYESVPRPFFGDFKLNLTGAPDDEAEGMRAAHEDLVRSAFREGKVKQLGDVVAIPLKAAREPDGGPMEKWGAAYVRLAVPGPPALKEPLTLGDVALGMGGATLAAMGLVFLLLQVVVLTPLARVASGARRIQAGELGHAVEPTGRGDEIDQLIRTFNEMQREIQQSRSALQKQVEEAVARVRATEKRMVLADRMAAMGTLAAGISHEINNPLGGMINAARSLRRRSEVSEAQDRYLKLIEDGLDRIRDLVQRVLRFARGGTGHAAVDLGVVIAEAARFVRHRLVERHADLAVQVEPGLLVRGDSGALGQVFLNLLMNAVDALGAEGGRIEVTGAWDGSVVRVTVRDTGRGMAPDQAARAFDLFYTTKDTGSGLGLSIVHLIVGEHGGSLALDSVEGRGTAVHLVLPGA